MKRRRPATLEPLAASAFVIVSLHVAITAGLIWWWEGHQARQSRSTAPLAWLSPGDFKSSTPTPPPAPNKPSQTVQANASTVTIAAPPPAAEAPAAPLEIPPPAQMPPAPVPALPATVEDEPVQKATLVAAPPDQHRMEPAPNDASPPLFAPATPAPKPSANRSITLRRMRSKPAIPTAGKSPAPPLSSPTLLDIARLNTMRTPSPPKPGAAAAADDNDSNAGLDAVDEAMNTAFLGVWTAPPIDAVPLAQRAARLNISLGKDGTVLKSQMSKFSGSHVLDQSILEAAANVKKIPVTLPANYSKESYDVELNFILLP